MNPSQNTQAQESHFKTEGCVYVCMCVYSYIHHMFEGGKEVCEAQKTSVAQGHSPLEKRK